MNDITSALTSSVDLNFRPIVYGRKKNKERKRIEYLTMLTLLYPLILLVFILLTLTSLIDAFPPTFHHQRSLSLHKKYPRAVSFSPSSLLSLDAVATKRGPMEVWIDTRNDDFGTHDNQKECFESCDTVLFSSKNFETFMIDDPPDNKKTIDAMLVDNNNDNIGDVKNGNDGMLILRDSTGRSVGAVVDLSPNKIGDDDRHVAKALDEATALIGSVDWIVLLPWSTSSSSSSSTIPSSSLSSTWTMIPAENFIASTRNTGTKVCVGAIRSSDVKGLTDALELGVDAVCVQYHCCTSNSGKDDNDGLWKTVLNAKEQRNNGLSSSDNDDKIDDDENAPRIVEGTCIRLQRQDRGSSGGSGGGGIVTADRVCVDLVQTLSTTEGIFAGSSVTIMSLILSEAVENLAYVPSRPFRVNAGPVHSYVLMGDGVTTKYLCELIPGDEVYVYDCGSGNGRAVAVGRLKVETRPCAMVSLRWKNNRQNIGVSRDDDGINNLSSNEINDSAEAAVMMEGQVFLQMAETVRLGREGGGDVRVTDLPVAGAVWDNDTHPGERVLLRVSGKGTHLGRTYGGKVVEK